MMIDQKNVLFVGGKGGVGKSTSAAAIALTLAQNSKKTLLVSTDPAHNVGDLFHQPLKNKAVEVRPNLDAIEIDPSIESRNYINNVKENIKGVVSAQMQQEVNRQIDAASSSPGAEEAAMFDRIVSLILDERERYDCIVFDTAPTGHTIRLLTLPEIMGVWIDGMLERRKKRNENYTQLLNDGEPIDDPIYQVLQTRKSRFAAVREILLDEKQTGFIFVLNPERLPIIETSKAIDMLKKHELAVDTLIINKVLSDEVDGVFWQKRKENERGYLAWIEQKFPTQQKHYIPLFPTDIHSVQLLEQYAKYL
ncbi:ArsA family ATPase [Mesobacillus maritimus]|uniref:ArsA family ATPase n=1 Tax=Mesobacillus maritimus TaxID=1643336 RepID=A0ABS7K4W8_9BACI|nr:ArsA family ATPase [Mesobacillus maritimus]